MRRLALCLLAGVLIVTATGIAPAAAQDRLQVVASFSILADVVAHVAGDAADVHPLAPIGADPHSFTPTPRDLVTLADADVIFLVGAGFEETLRETIASAARTTPVIVSSCVDILPFGATHDHGATDTGTAQASPPAPAGADPSLASLCAAHHAALAALHGTDAPPDPAASESLGMLYTLACTPDASADHTDEAGTCDPHVWMDPHNGMYWVMLIRDTLTALDPAHAADYTANASAYLASLQALADDELSPLLDSVPVANRKLVTNHDAFGYFAHAYGFEVVGAVIPGGSTLAEPSAAEVAALIDLIRTSGVPAVFTETTVNSTLAEQVAAETGAQFYALYSGTLSAPDGPAATYEDYLRYNARTIATALDGSAS